MSTPIPGPNRPPGSGTTPATEATDCWPVPAPTPHRSWRSWVYWAAAAVAVLASFAPMLVLRPGGHPVTLWGLAGEHGGGVAIAGLVLLAALVTLLVVLGVVRAPAAGSTGLTALIALVSGVLLLLRPTAPVGQTSLGWGGILELGVLAVVVVVATGHTIELARKEARR